MDSYQILVFENQEIYDSLDDVSADKAVQEYVKKCQIHLPPEYTPQEYTSFDSDKMFVKYSDRCGDDKPMMILMIGLTSPEMIKSIEEGLRKIYFNNCEDCGKEIDLKWCVCRECRIK
jgi:hypothetical protein